MLDEETFNAMHVLHVAFAEGRDFPTLLDEPPSAEIETSWSNSVRSVVMIGVAFTIVCSFLYHLSIALFRQKHVAPTIMRHPRCRPSNDERI
eukprot:scaffold30436_cov160-Skeletonema_menzelii.AAC.4